MTLNAALNANGDTKVYRNFLITGFVANCVLNPVLMFGWTGLLPLGVAGVALATVIVQIGGCVFLWSGIRKRGYVERVAFAEFVPDITIVRQIAAQAVPAGLNMLTVAIGIFVITWFVKHFGKEAVAAYGIATRIEQVVLLPTIGLNFAVLSLVGQNNGAGRMDRVHEVWRVGLKYGIGLMLAGGALVFAVRHLAMAFFTKDTAVIEHGGDYLSIAAITLCAYPILFQTVFMLQGLKKPAYGLWIGLYRQIVAPRLVFHALSFTLGWGLWGIWWGISIVTWSAALFTLWWGGRTLRHHAAPVSTPTT
jgi:putative MATE family efflux protein